MDVYAPLAALGKFAGYFARYGCDFALQISHAGLAGVVLDYFLQSRFVERRIFFGQPVFWNLAFDQIPARDFHFFGFGISRDFKYFHAVHQCRWDCVKRVGSGEE